MFLTFDVFTVRLGASMRCASNGLPIVISISLSSFLPAKLRAYRSGERSGKRGSEIAVQEAHMGHLIPSRTSVKIKHTAKGTDGV